MLNSLTKFFILLVLVLITEDTHVYASVPVMEASKNMKLLDSVDNGKLYLVNGTASDGTLVTLPVVSVKGTAYEMGYAQGFLLAENTWSFYFSDLPISAILGKANEHFNNAALPQHIQDNLRDAKGSDIVVAILEALTWVWDTQYKYLPVDLGIEEEVRGLVDGMCEKLKNCEGREEEYTFMIKLYNMIPELSRMRCSVLASWGDAHPTDKRHPIQLRALDYGEGPYAKNSLVIIRRPTEGLDFVSLAFPGFVGAVTSYNKHMAQAEKVWMSPDDIDRGTYNGLSDTLVIRYIMQYKETLTAAMEYMNSVKRTWGVFLSFVKSVYSSKDKEYPHLGVSYETANVTRYTDETNNIVTGTDNFKDVFYLNRGIQPNKDVTLANLIKAQHGKITGEWVATTVPAALKSGDVHLMVVDHNSDSVYVAVGKAPNYAYLPNGNAYEQPLIRFSHSDLLNKL